MSLATRCPACGTTFRVVQDQLKISGGWVRCGQCHQVFNGLEALLELPASPPPAAAAAPTPAASPTPAPAEPPAPVIAFRALPPDPPAPADTAVDLADEPEPPPAAPAASAAPEPEPEPEPETAPFANDLVAPIPTGEAQEIAAEPAAAWLGGVDLTRDQPELAPSDFDPIVSVPPFSASRFAPSSRLGDDPQASRPSAANADDADDAPASGDADAAEPPRARRRRKPRFMRQAERAAQWRRPAVRAVLASAAGLLTLVLLGQVVHSQRHELAARWPALRGPLQAGCDWLHCTIEPPRALARLTLDSSSLLRTDSAQVLRFEADLHNSADHVVRAPALELSFNDLQGRLVVRKVLLPAALGAPAEGLAADGLWHVDARLNVGDLQITGFSAEVFYP